MPSRCIAIGCINTADEQRKPEAQIELEKVMKISFHSFPSNPIRRMQWIKIMKLENVNINKRSRLCSLHFKDEFMDRTSSLYLRLRDNAVPHIFEDTLDVEMENEISLRNEMEELPLRKVTSSMCDKATNTSLSLLSQERRPTEDKETRISPERIWNMNNPTVELIRKSARFEVETLRKKMRVLQQKVTRKEKKIAVMKNILDELKIENLISD